MVKTPKKLIENLLTSFLENSKIQSPLSHVVKLYVELPVSYIGVIANVATVGNRDVVTCQWVTSKTPKDQLKG